MIISFQGLPTKQRRYYAELCLDDDIYARTSVKEIEEKNHTQTGSIVWGEYFEFPFLPDKQIKVRGFFGHLNVKNIAPKCIFYPKYVLSPQSYRLKRSKLT